jgi:hypothetical protein
MVSLTNREMVLLVGALRELSQKELRPKLAFWVAKTARDVDGVMSVYDESRQALLEKHAIRNDSGEVQYEEDGQSIKVDPAFWGELNELLDARGADVREIDAELLESSLDGKISTALANALMPVVVGIEV